MRQWPRIRRPYPIYKTSRVIPTYSQYIWLDLRGVIQGGRGWYNTRTLWHHITDLVWCEGVGRTLRLWDWLYYWAALPVYYRLRRLWLWVRYPGAARRAREFAADLNDLMRKDMGNEQVPR